MALLSIDGIEPVKIRGRICTPKVDTELKLRLQSITTYSAETDDILASAFPENKEYVKSFLSSDNVTTLDKEILHAYLIGGDNAVKAVINRLNGAMEGE